MFLCTSYTYKVHLCQWRASFARRQRGGMLLRKCIECLRSDFLKIAVGCAVCWYCVLVIPPLFFFLFFSSLVSLVCAMDGSAVVAAQGCFAGDDSVVKMAAASPACFSGQPGRGSAWGGKLGERKSGKANSDEAFDTWCQLKALLADFSVAVSFPLGGSKGASNRSEAAARSAFFWKS